MPALSVPVIEKIAISGAHFTGKTALLDDLSRSLRKYKSYEEPYYLLEKEGHEFFELPSIEDYEKQVNCSIELIMDSKQNAIFDRCPLDFLAYINVHEDFSFFDINNWDENISEAMEQIDLVVLVPIENPDLIICPHSAYPELRQRVNLELQNLVYEFERSSDIKILEVNGTIKNRSSQILTFINSN
jgi:AAA domain